MRFVTVLIAAAALGCASTRIADLTLVSNQNVPNVPDPIRHVTGLDCSFWTQPNLETAIDDAHRQVAKGNALANVGIFFDVQSYVLVTKQCFRIEADAVRFESEEEVVARAVERQRRLRSQGQKNYPASQGYRRR